MTALDLLERLVALAFAASARTYLVGGCVRDHLLGRDPSDVDLLVEGDPARLLDALAGAAAHPPVVFSRQEPVTWRLTIEGFTVDVSAFPDGHLREALARRDFTINTLAVPLDRLWLAGLDTPVDLLGGLSDLRQRRIRHVSATALEEDPVRLLRAVRLRAVLEGFHLDAELRAEMTARAALAATAPGERVAAEMELILAGPRSGEGLRLMHETGLLLAVLPELEGLAGLAQGRWHRFDALEHTLRCVEEADALQRDRAQWGFDAPMPPFDAQVLKWAALLHDAGKPATSRLDEAGEVHFHGHDAVSADITRQTLRRLRVPTRTSERVSALVENHLRLTGLSASGEAGPRALRRLVSRMKHDTPLLCLLALADRRAGGGPDFERHVARLEEAVRAALHVYRDEGERVIAPEPLLTGDDVMRILKLPAGPRVGAVMRWLARLQVDGRLSTREDAEAMLRSLPPARLPEAGRRDAGG